MYRVRDSPANPRLTGLMRMELPMSGAPGLTTAMAPSLAIGTSFRLMLIVSVCSARVGHNVTADGHVP
eukprot:scaffold146577_cov40-Prasinocladus_malaysianus.AAC.1